MLKLIYYQFQFSKRQWLGTIPVLLVSSMIIGLSLNGVFSIEANSEVFKSLDDPTPIFISPIIFGGITLFLVLSTLIQSLITIFKDDYQRWSILGANKNQLSFLIGGQLFLISVVSSLLGYLLSIPITKGYYHFLQSFVGEKQLPNIDITVNFTSLILTIVIISLTSFISGYYFSFRLPRKEGNKKSLLSLIKQTILLVLLLGSWGGAVFQVFFPYSTMAQAPALFFLLIVHVFLIYQFSPHLQIALIKLFSKLLLRKNAEFIIAKWNILHNPSYIKSMSAALITSITLISGFQIISQNIAVAFQKNSELELRVALLVYLVTPILVILANIISITILTSKQEKNEADQLSLLGVSKSQLILIKLHEACLHSIIVFIISLFFNGIIFFLAVHIVRSMQSELINWSGMFSSGIFISIVLAIIIFTSKISTGFILNSEKVSDY